MFTVDLRRRKFLMATVAPGHLRRNAAFPPCRKLVPSRPESRSRKVSNKRSFPSDVSCRPYRVRFDPAAPLGEPHHGAAAVIGLALDSIAVEVLVDLGIQNPLGKRLLQLVHQTIFIENGV